MNYCFHLNLLNAIKCTSLNIVIFYQIFSTVKCSVINLTPIILIVARNWKIWNAVFMSVNRVRPFKSLDIHAGPSINNTLFWILSVMRRKIRHGPPALKKFWQGQNWVKSFRTDITQCSVLGFTLQKKALIVSRMWQGKLRVNHGHDPCLHRRGSSQALSKTNCPPNSVELTSNFFFILFNYAHCYCFL